MISPPVISSHCGITASHMILFVLTLFHIFCILSLKVTVLFTAPLAQDLQIGRIVVEIISGLAMVYRE